MESDKQIDNEKLKMDKRISKTLFYSDIRQILQSARNKAYAAVNTAMVEAYWSIGKGFSVANLKNFRQFYLVFTQDEKGYTLCSQLSWSHNRLILSTENELKAELKREIQMMKHRRRESNGT